MQRSAADATPGPASVGPGAAAPPEPAGAAGRSEPPAWQALPPIQRVTPTEPRLNLPETFTGALTAWRDPSYLAPLGHLVGAAEPSGVLHDAALPAPEPRRPEPEPAARPSPDVATPLPLATPPARGGRLATPVQRRVGDLPTPGLPSAETGAGPALAGPDGPAPAGALPSARPVALEPVPVSRLVTAPPPAVELHLPTVDAPVCAAEPPAEPVPGPAGPAEPADPPAAPTLGQDLPPAGLPGPAGGGDVTGPAAGVTAPATAGPSTVDLPVQRLPGEAARPHRRLGLGEPIVSPLPGPTPSATGPTDIPTAQRALDGAAGPRHPPAPVDAAMAARVPPTDTALPLAQRTPADTAQRTPADTAQRTPEGTAQRTPEGTGPAAITGPADGPGDPAGAVGSAPDLDARTDPGAAVAGPHDAGSAAAAATSAPADQLAGLVGDTSVARLPADAPAEPGPRTGPPAAGDLPVTGPAPGGSAPSGDAAGPPSPTAPGTGVPVQTYLPPDAGAPTGARVAPLLSTGGGPAGSGVDPGRAARPAAPGDLGSAGPDLPVVSRLEGPGAAARDAGAGPAGQPVTPGDPPADGTPFPGHDEAAPGPDGAEPGTAALVGGYGEPTGTPGDPTGGSEPSAAAPLPVVARLVGDRPLRPLTGEVPDLSGPVAPPPVQRVSWQHESVAAPVAVPAPSPDPQGLAPTHHDLPTVAGQPGATGPLGTGAGHGPLPVQRWVGALPGTTANPGGGGPSATYPGGGGIPPAYPGGAGIPLAYPGGPADPARTDPGERAVQRAETVEPPPADPPAGPAAAPAATAPLPGTAAGAEPEELLKKLYDPLLRRLKTELRLDRERHGVLGGPG
ncbi:hypothetical protein [Micromonospora sp. NPDC050495]|uniref:hypothetical protein n=1 Tax=Micromonospora sp. NPDC050495 TaxID=3154936 RepID=UPI003400659A